ncbi:hypothetical protein GCM10018966_009100 [Streptomyces yanii]
MAQGLAADELARLVGLEASACPWMEESRHWRGNERQSAALSEALGLSAAGFVTATGRYEEPADLLRSAVTTHRQAYTRPVAKLVPLERRLPQGVLERLHGDYQALMVSTLSWSTGRAERGADGEAGRAFLDGIVERFRETAGV